MNKKRVLSTLVLIGTTAASLTTTAMTPPAGAARATIRSAFNLVGGEDPTFDPLNPSVAEARWQAPVRRVDIFHMDPARFPATVRNQANQNVSPCIATLSLDTLSGTAPVVFLAPGTNAGISDNVQGTDGMLGKVDVVCDWIDRAGVTQHHETHWAGELGTAPVASVANAIVDFGGVKVGQLGVAQDVSLTNIGNAPLHVASAALSGLNAGDFSIVDDGCSGATVAAGSSCAVSTRFVPSVGTARQAKLTFTDDSPTPTQVTTLKGLGLQASILVSPLTIDFGKQRPLSNSVQTFTAVNNGNDVLHMASMVLSGTSDFKIVSDGCSRKTLAVNAGCSVTIKWSPTTLGSRTASVNVGSDAPSSIAHVVSLKGTSAVV